MNVIPVRGWVLVEREQADISAGGIHLPKGATEPGGTDSGRVLAVGTGPDELTAPTVHLNERVVFMKKHGIQLKGQLSMVRDENIMAVIEE